VNVPRPNSARGKPPLTPVIAVIDTYCPSKFIRSVRVACVPDISNETAGVDDKVMA